MIKLRKYQCLSRFLAGLMFMMSVSPLVAHACEMGGMGDGHNSEKCCCVEGVTHRETESSHHSGHAAMEADRASGHGHHLADEQHEDRHHQKDHRDIPCDERAPLNQGAVYFEGTTCCGPVGEAAEVEAIVQDKPLRLSVACVDILRSDDFALRIPDPNPDKGYLPQDALHPTVTRLYLVLGSFLN